jgi:hypothetical protein
MIAINFALAPCFTEIKRISREWELILFVINSRRAPDVPGIFSRLSVDASNSRFSVCDPSHFPDHLG